MRAFVIFAILCVGLCAAQAPCTCSSPPGQLWGDVNPNVFHFCESATNTTQQLSCPSGRGFLNIAGAYGCVPFTQWPACCINQVASPPVCTSANASHPSEATNPNQFYLCPSAGATALLMTCPEGKGFLTGDCGALGCVDWAEWRAAKNCNTY